LLNLNGADSESARTSKKQLFPTKGTPTSVFVPVCFQQVVHGTFLVFPVLSTHAESGGAHMARQSEGFYSDAARSLILAVIHQAITDVLQNAEDAEAAKQWLRSKDCDSLLEACGCDAAVFRYPQQRSAEWIS
jgi:hypothetical protein